MIDFAAPQPPGTAGAGDLVLQIATVASGAAARDGRTQHDTDLPPPAEPAPDETGQDTQPPVEARKEDPKPVKAPKEWPEAVTVPDQEPVIRATAFRHVPVVMPTVPKPRKKPSFVPPAKPAKVPEPRKSPEPEPRPNVETAVSASKSPPRETDTAHPRGRKMPAGDAGQARQTQVARTGGGVSRYHGEYFVVVRAWLQEHKRYPRRARLRMMQGEALIDFVIDRSGRVVSYELQKSTGYDVLDREVVAMIRRASPMPAFPPDLAGNKIRLSIPVNYGMR